VVNLDAEFQGFKEDVGSVKILQSLQHLP